MTMLKTNPTSTKHQNSFSIYPFGLKSTKKIKIVLNIQAVIVSIRLCFAKTQQRMAKY